jgi:hypothetical protein
MTFPKIDPFMIEQMALDIVRNQKAEQTMSEINGIMDKKEKQVADLKLEKQTQIEEPEESEVIEEIKETIPEELRNEPIIPDPHKPLLDFELNKDEVLLESENLSILIQFKEIKVQDNFLVIILKQEDNKRLIIHPYSNMSIYLRTEKTIYKYKILYSGIFFIHNNDSFLVFHKEKKSIEEEII